MKVKDQFQDTLQFEVDDEEVFLKIESDGQPPEVLFRLAVESEREAVVALRDSLSAALGDTQSEVAPPETDQDFNLGAFQFAAATEHGVQFRYAKGNGAVIEQRTVFPASVTKAGENLLVVGYDPDREEPRAYRLDRIKGRVNIFT